MNKVIKKFFRSLMYIVGIGAMALVPDAWLWHIGVGEWPLPLAILWWIPSLLIILAEVGLQLGKFHRTSVSTFLSHPFLCDAEGGIHPLRILHALVLRHPACFGGDGMVPLWIRRGMEATGGEIRDLFFCRSASLLRWL